MTTLQEVNADLARRNARTRLEPSAAQGTLRIRYSIHGRLHRLSPGIANDQEGLLRAEAMAVVVSQQLKDGTFDLNEWRASKSASQLTFHTAIARYEAQRNGRGDWREYWAIYKRLPLTERFSAGPMRAVVLKLAEGSRQRLRAGIALGALARFQGQEELAQELRALGKGYDSFKSTKPRHVPTDQEIEEAALKLSEEWRWGFWIMSLYGCRPHEIFRSDQQGKLLYVSGGKTGSRVSLPTKAEWLEKPGRRILPNVDLTRPNRELGALWCKVFKRHGIEWTPYCLRHAAALRMIHNPRIKDSMAARSLGHSLSVHTKTYQKWISEKEFLALLG